MPESTEPSLIQPVAGEAQSESANAVRSENGNSVLQGTVPPNFVEIYQTLKPVVSPVEEKEADETVDEARSPGEEHLMGEVTQREQEQKATNKEPLLSKKLYQEASKAFYRGDMQQAIGLVEKSAAQSAAERKVAAQAQARAAGPPDHPENEDEDDDEFPEEDQEEQSDVQPDQINVNIGGRPAKTAGLSAMDLIRRAGRIEAVRYHGAGDGVINQFPQPFRMPWDLGSLYEPMILPAGVEGFRTTRELFNGISALLHKHVMLPNKECSLLAYWAIATWFTNYLPFLPSVVISGPASTADLLLRTLAAVCRRPVLLGELSPAILRKLPINEISPTLLIREPQLSRYISSLLNASNQPGYLFFSGKTFQPLYCAKCIYVGECFKDSPAASNVVHISLGGSAPTPRHALPAKDEITSFQNRLLCYRILNHDKVAAANFRASGFRPEISQVADVLAAAIVDDVDLQRGIIEVLKDRDEQSRVDRATGVNGLVLRAVLFHCHQKEERKFVREIAATANGFYADDGESLKVSNEAVGHALKYLGLYSRRLGNAGRGLIFDKATQAHAHRLSHSHDVFTSEPSCEYCHGLQQSQSEEVVQDV